MVRSDAFGKATVLPEHFEPLAAPRERDKVRDTLDAALLLCLSAVPAGAEAVADIARIGENEKKLTLLRRFRGFCHGVPSHDQVGTVLASLDSAQFRQRFVACAPAEVIAIDGKYLRRSAQTKAGKSADHMVTAFAARWRLVLGRVEVAEKANEIAAIRLLLDTIPDLDMAGRERTPVGGEVPNPINPPRDCSFPPRCPFANDRCRAENPMSTACPAGRPWPATGSRRAGCRRGRCWRRRRCRTAWSPACTAADRFRSSRVRYRPDDRAGW